LNTTGPVPQGTGPVVLSKKKPRKKSEKSAGEKQAEAISDDWKMFCMTL
jgi:hypothetical protein